MKENKEKSCCCLSYERGVSPCLCGCHTSPQDTVSNWEKELNNFLDKYVGTSDWLVPKSARKNLIKRINLIFSKQKEEIEHCDVPECPECNIKAYNKGKEDAKEEIIKMVQEKIKDAEDINYMGDMGTTINYLSDIIKKLQ